MINLIFNTLYLTELESALVPVWLDGNHLHLPSEDRLGLGLGCSGA